MLGSLNKLNFSLIFILNIILPTIVSSQSENETFFLSNVYLQYNPTNSTSSYGSGFFIFKKYDSLQSKIFLVTNKHVLPPEGVAKDLTIKFPYIEHNLFTSKELKISIFDTNKIYNKLIKKHRNNEIDVAIIDVTEVLSSIKYKIRPLSFDLLASNDDLTNNEIYIGDDILVLGYPDGIYDEKLLLPLVRSGIISSLPANDYHYNLNMRNKYDLPSTLHGFLIDAIIFPGSSGSMVILKSEYRPIIQNKLIAYTRKASLILGIVRGSLPIFDSALNSYARIGIGIVESSISIRELINEFDINQNSKN